MNAVRGSDVQQFGNPKKRESIHLSTDMTGECDEDGEMLIVRTNNLAKSLGQDPSSDPVDGLFPEELAGCATRTLTLP